VVRCSQFRRALYLAWIAVLVTASLQRVLCQESGSESTSKSRKSSASPKSFSPDRGTLSDGVYRNPYFGFQIKLPYGWVDRSDEMRQNDDPPKSMLLLGAFERPPEATGDTVNSAVVITAEKMSQFSGLKTAADYFGPITELATARDFKAVNPPYDFLVGIKPLVRGDFSKQRGSLTMVQSSVVMLDKGYAVSITFIAGSQDEADGLIGGLQFGAPGKKPAASPH
jgi:hypothetical protein